MPEKIKPHKQEEIDLQNAEFKRLLSDVHISFEQEEILKLVANLFFVKKGEVLYYEKILDSLTRIFTAACVPALLFLTKRDIISPEAWNIFIGTLLLVAILGGLAAGVAAQGYREKSRDLFGLRLDLEMLMKNSFSAEKVDEILKMLDEGVKYPKDQDQQSTTNFLLEDIPDPNVLQMEFDDQQVLARVSAPAKKQ